MNWSTAKRYFTNVSGIKFGFELAGTRLYTGLALQVSPYNAELILYKPWRVFQFKIIVNVLVSSF